MSDQKTTESLMFIITAPCWSCKKSMQLALVGNESGSLEYGPESFSDSEKILAEKNGALLKIVNSKTAEETYLANTCGLCDQFVGQWFFFAHYFTPALYGKYKYKKLLLS